MKKIMTVKGPIKPSELKTSSMHDHVLSDMDLFKSTLPPERAKTSPINVDDKIKIEDLCYLQNGYHNFSKDNWDLKDVELMTQEVRYFKERGGHSILDPSAPGISHDIQKLKKISEDADVNIIASTGLYVEDSWPVEFKSMNEKQYYDFIMNEINQGIRGTDIKPGHIKTATRQGAPNEINVFKAAAKASIETGLSVTVHNSYATKPENRQKCLDVYLESGMDLTKLIFCHIQYSFLNTSISHFIDNPASLKLDLDWAKKIMDLGGNICIDLFGYPLAAEFGGQFNMPDIFRLLATHQLIEEGYGDHIVVGCDVYQKLMTRSMGGHGYSRTLDYLAPQLLENGIAQEKIDKIFIDNPARILEY